MKTLVVYYSRSGNTRLVAQEISSAIDCDIEEIADTKNWSGTMGFLRAGRDAAGHKLTVLEDIKNDPDDYDLIIIGTPIWGGNISVPVRTYIAGNSSRFNKVAFFCTAKGSDFIKVFDDMENLSNLVPIATIGITEREIKNVSYRSQVAGFIDEIRD